MVNPASVVLDPQEYLRRFRENGVRRFDWWLIDPRLVMGARFIVWPRADRVMHAWFDGARFPNAGADVVGMRGTIIQLVASHKRLGVPWARVLFDDAPRGSFEDAAQCSQAWMQALPSAACHALPDATVPHQHWGVLRCALRAAGSDDESLARWKASHVADPAPPLKPMATSMSSPPVPFLPVPLF